MDCLTPPLPEVPEDDWYCPVCEPIVFGQHQLQFSSTENEDDFEWPSSSGSEIELRSHRKISKVRITDSDESESDSDNDVFRNRPTVLNVRNSRVFDSESSDEEELTRELARDDDDSEEMYIDLLRNFSKRSSQPVTPTNDVSRVLEESTSLLSKSRVQIKSCSVPITPIQSKAVRQTSNQHISQTSTSQPTLQNSTAQSSRSSAQPSTSQFNTRSRRKKRKRKQPRLLLSNKKRTESKKNFLSCQEKVQRPQMFCRRRRQYNSQSSVMETRSRARTVATYTPQQNVFRAAARELYRHADLDTGLQNARRIILESETSFRHPRTPLKTPQSGYVNNNRKISLRAASEIKKRTVPHKNCFLMDNWTFENPVPSSNAHTSGKTSSNLLDDIYQGLDVLNSKDSIVRRDGTIVAPSKSIFVYIYIVYLKAPFKTG